MSVQVCVCFLFLVLRFVWIFYTRGIGFLFLIGELSCCSLQFVFTGGKAWLLSDSFLSHHSIINWSHMLRSFAAGAQIVSVASFDIDGMIVLIDSAK
jgi:hypothetical protein